MIHLFMGFKLFSFSILRHNVQSPRSKIHDEYFISVFITRGLFATQPLYKQTERDYITIVNWLHTKKYSLPYTLRLRNDLVIMFL